MTKVKICTLPNNVSWVNIPDKESLPTSNQHTIPITETHTNPYHRPHTLHPQSFPTQQHYQLTIPITNESHSSQNVEELANTFDSQLAQPASIADKSQNEVLASTAHSQAQRRHQYQAVLDRERVEIQNLSIKIKSLHLINDRDIQQKKIAKTLAYLQTTIDQLFDKAEHSRSQAAATTEQKNLSAMTEDYAYGEFFLSAYKQIKKA